jgi:hypothetical protein
VRLLALILIHPRTAAGELRLRPVWLGSFLVLALLSAGALLVQHRSRVEETVVHLPPHLTSAQRSAVAADLDARLTGRALMHPARLLLGWSAFALLLLVACRTAVPDIPLRFAQVLALQVHCAAAEVLGSWLLPVLRGLLPEPLLQPGLLAAGPLLNSLNIFTIWYVVLLIAGVGVLCAARPLKATLLVLLVWGSSLAFQTAVFRVLRDVLHLAV